MSAHGQIERHVAQSGLTLNCEPVPLQPLDLNCNSTTPGDICGAYGERTGSPITITGQVRGKLQRSLPFARVPCRDAVVTACAWLFSGQGIGMSLIPLADGSTAYLWSGERWLSAPDNNPSCPDECRPETGQSATCHAVVIALPYPTLVGPAAATCCGCSCVCFCEQYSARLVTGMCCLCPPHGVCVCAFLLRRVCGAGVIHQGPRLFVLDPLAV